MGRRESDPPLTKAANDDAQTSPLARSFVRPSRDDEMLSLLPHFLSHFLRPISAIRDVKWDVIKFGGLLTPTLSRTHTQSEPAPRFYSPSAQRSGLPPTAVPTRFGRGHRTVIHGRGGEAPREGAEMQC